MADPALLTDLPDQRAVLRRAAPFLAGHRLAVAATVLLLRLNQLALTQAVCVAGLLVVSAVMVGRGALSVGVAVVFVLATRDIFHRFEDLAGAVGDAREAHVRLARLLDLLRATGEEHRPAARGQLPPCGELALENVTFGYRTGPPVLDALTFAVDSGERLVIAGETGSGKSTLGKLLAGLYAPDRGTVRFAGPASPRWTRTGCAPGPSSYRRKCPSSTAPSRRIWP
ncbi:ATP-binding cassette domain-containing protein [Streptomyces sp. ZL-24]|uniref:ATP-binding cassette domain-containing protein n=2 Tax=Streptomyces TaxID=1883 RepID=UPI00240A0A3F|nr:ATP-binding cassette domain-containing protein [Streptomyces sp. ZL-24]